MNSILLFLFLMLVSFNLSAKECFIDEGLTPGEKQKCIKPVLDKLCYHAGLQSCRESRMKTVTRYREIEKMVLLDGADLCNPEDVDAIVDYFIAKADPIEQSLHNESYIDYIKRMMEKRGGTNN